MGRRARSPPRLACLSSRALRELGARSRHETSPPYRRQFARVRAAWLGLRLSHGDCLHIGRILSFTAKRPGRSGELRTRSTLDLKSVRSEMSPAACFRLVVSSLTGG